MGYEIRAIEDDEFGKFQDVLSTAFGFQADEQTTANWRSTTEMDRTIAVFDKDEAVASAGAFSFDLTVPGLTQVAAAGVTAVSVRTTHKRRKILTSMMR